MELTGVLVIVGGALIASILLIRSMISLNESAYDFFRKRLGKSILLGLEFLVAGDIIRTVAIEPTLTSVTILGLIVLIRTFLSFSLGIELDGKLPWKR